MEVTSVYKLSKSVNHTSNIYILLKNNIETK